MPPIAPSHAHLGRGERREKEREIRTLMFFYYTLALASKLGVTKIF
jgi:hypothetical protein